MSMLQFLYVYLLTVPVFFAFDMLWLGVVATGFYKSQIGFLLGPVNWMVAIMFYLLYIIGILVFSVYPALHANSLETAILLGALFGFLAYATYDLTNFATIKNWPLLVTIVDIVWGTILTAGVSAASYYLAKTFVV